MRSGLIAVRAAVFLAGCSGLTSPDAPPAAGTYDTFFNFTASAPSISSTQSLQQALGTVTLGAPAEDGSFVGSFALQNNGGSGTVTGTMAGNGGVSITHFGDPNETPLQALAYLETLLPGCDFTQAVSSIMDGAVSGGALALTGGLTLPCPWNTANGVVIAPTTIAAQFSGTEE
jgi:hypothetical protein